VIDDRLVNERGGVSPEMAMRLAKAFGSTSEMCDAAASGV
jgi:plasmid maintenance system antidote protein VapI